MGLAAIDISIIIFYLVLVLGVGIYTGKNIKNFRDFSIGSYGFHDSTMVATIAATWIGADVLLGISEKIYQEGMIWIFIFLSGAMMEMLLLKHLAPKLSRFKGYITPAEILGNWYGDKRVRMAAGFCIIALCASTIGVQIAALGILTRELLGISPLYGMIICTSIVVVYASIGGLRSVVATDTIQFAFFIVAIPLVSALLLQKVGGIEVMIKKAPTQHFSLLPSYNEPEVYLLMLIFFMIPYADPALIQRTLAAKDAEQISNTFKATAIIFALFYPILAVIGLATSAIDTSLEPSSIVYHTVSHFLPIGIKGLVIAGIIAIIMSSADSYLNLASVTIIHDIVIPLRKKHLTVSMQLFIIRTTTFIVGMLATLFAITSDSIIELLLHSYILWSPVMIIPLYSCFFGVKANTRVFVISGIAGLITTFTWLIIGTEDIPEILPGILINLICFTLMSFYYYKRRPEELYIPTANIIPAKGKPLKERISEFIAKLTYENLCRCIVEYFPTPWNIARFSAYKVKIFGAQYRIYGFFAITFYLVSYALWSVPIVDNNPAQLLAVYTSSAFHFVGALLAFGLIVFDIWPQATQKYLPVYWHFTLMYCLAFMTNFAYFSHRGEGAWLINLSMSLFLLATLVDWINFLLLALIGSVLSYLSYSFIFGSNTVLQAFHDIGNLKLYLYMVLFSSVVGIVFSRNREYVQVVLRNKLLDQANEDLAKTLNFKDDMLNNVSHEVRTPVQAVTGMSRGLVDSWELLTDEQRYNYARKVAQASQRMISLMNNLLDMSKITAGKMVLRCEYSNIKQIIDEMIEECNLLYINDKPITLELTINGQIPNTMLDAERMTQVLRNLLANAVKFTEKGTILLSLSYTNNLIQVSVQDQGIGIPDSERDAIFEPFVQSSKTMTGAGGTGLGLAICRNIIAQHGGNIWAEPGENSGARFIFTIPVKKPPNT